MDQTKHLTEGHREDRPPIKHSKEWYGYWGNKCPDCGADADVREANDGTK